ncbi:hypothetical protein Tco_0046301 [Tanacetum coccineum]
MNLMFDSGVLEDDVMHVEAKVDGKDEQSKKPDDSIDDSVVPTTSDEITLAQTLIQIKAAKPKVVTTTATTTTTTRPKDRIVVVQEQSEFRVPQETQPSSSKDKGKGIMIEPEVPLKRKDQIALDEQIARNIQAKLDAELLEEQKLARKQEEEASIALIESWENTQAMIKANRLLAERLQLKEREELTDEEKAILFMELMEKRRKHFTALRAQEKRNIPSNQGSKQNLNVYLSISSMEMKIVNTFVAMGSEVHESKEKKEEGREETAKGVLQGNRIEKVSPLGTLWKDSERQKYGDTRPENEFERVLYGDLKVMFEPEIKSDVWRMLQGYRATIWKLIDSSRVHFVRRNLKIQKMNIKFRGGLLGLKRLHGFLEVTAAQVLDFYQQLLKSSQRIFAASNLFSNT